MPECDHSTPRTPWTHFLKPETWMSFPYSPTSLSFSPINFTSKTPPKCVLSFPGNTAWLRPSSPLASLPQRVTHEIHSQQCCQTCPSNIKSDHVTLFPKTIQWSPRTLRITLSVLGQHVKLLNRLVVAKGGGRGGGREWEVGVSRCKLLYREGINNKVLLYSTEN